MTKTQICIISMIGVGVLSAVTASRDKQDAESASVSDSLLEASGTQAAQPETDTQAGEQSPETAPPVETQAPTQGVTPTQAPASQPTETTTERIKWTFNTELSRRVSEMVVAKFPNSCFVYDPTILQQIEDNQRLEHKEITKPWEITRVINSGDPAKILFDAVIASSDISDMFLSSHRICAVVYNTPDNYYYVGLTFRP